MSGGSVPVPTFVEQDAWYTLTTGQLNPNIADTVPDITYLQPSSSPQGDLDGIVGSLDQAVIYLAGIAAPLDGGQKWLMWIADSLAVDDSANIFCPFADTSTPGRWINTGTQTSGPGGIKTTRNVDAGTTSAVASATTPLVEIFVGPTRAANTTTILTMPGSTFLGQEFTFKDAAGDCGAYNIIINGAIDGDTSYTLGINYAGLTLSWNGTEWSVT